MEKEETAVKTGVAELALQKAASRAGIIDTAINHLFEKINALEITNREEHIAAGVLLKSVKVSWDEYEEERKGIAKPLNDAKNKLQAAYVPKLNRLAELKKIVSGKIVAYEKELKRVADKQQQKLIEDARKEEAKQRKNLEERATNWEIKDPAKAKALREQAEEVSVAVPTIATPEKVQGLAGRVTYYAEVTDFKVLPDEFKIADMSKLNKQANTLKKEGSCFVPGIIIRKKETKY